MLFFLLCPFLTWLNPPKINDDQKNTLTISGPCCCGTSNELIYPNLDFEDGPIAPPGGWIDYTSGQNYGPWIVTSGSISIHAPDHGNLGAGNPNGSSQHLDLHGFNQGSEGISVKLLQIYDRWGNLIFSIQNTPVNDPNYGWNGYFKNQKVLPGVFTYYAELIDEENKIIKKLGEITIIR